MSIPDAGRANGPKDWKIGLFEIGDCKLCCYSYWCPQCAMAESRNNLDGSGLFFNFMCLRIVPYRWMVRSAYEIGDPEISRHDWLIGMVVPCCAVNQIYQTTQAYKNPTKNGGRTFNTNEWIKQPEIIRCSSCIQTYCCYPCTVATTLNESVGMPWSIGFFCMGCNPCLLRNLVRYQYRIQADEDDCTDDFVYSSISCMCVAPLLIMTCLLPVYFCPLFTTGFLTAFYTSQLQVLNHAKEEARHSYNTKRSYLCGYITKEQRLKMRGELINAARAVAEIQTNHNNPISSSIPQQGYQQDEFSTYKIDHDTSTNPEMETNLNPYATPDFTSSIANKKLNNRK